MLLARLAVTRTARSYSGYARLRYPSVSATDWSDRRSLCCSRRKYSRTKVLFQLWQRTSWRVHEEHDILDQLDNNAFYPNRSVGLPIAHCPLSLHGSDAETRVWWSGYGAVIILAVFTQISIRKQHLNS